MNSKTKELEDFINSDQFKQFSPQVQEALRDELKQQKKRNLKHGN